MKTYCPPSRLVLKLSLGSSLALTLVLGVSCAAVYEPEQARPASASLRTSSPGHNVAPGVSVLPKLPPLPPGLTELKFSEFFVTPAGPRGLELTEKLRDLDGRRVRILGYMVRQEEAPQGRLLLTPLPAEIHEHDNGLADDLPASTLFVSVPTLVNEPVPYAPGLMLLTGTLSVGNRAEPDGRISTVRLALDPPSSVDASRRKERISTPVGKGAERLTPGVSRKRNAAP